MKSNGILNAPFAARLATLGHTDVLTICDAGLPIPDEAQRVDLCVCSGIPSFIDVLRAVLNDIVVEQVILSEDIKENNPTILQEIQALIGDIPISFISHTAFKDRSTNSKAIVRTGEFTPFANIHLVCGCAF